MMKFFKKAKDGGPKSTVTGYWLCEIKSLFSIVLLRFDHGSRDEFHDHAFDSLNWVLRGNVLEQVLEGSDEDSCVGRTEEYGPSLVPVVTRRDRFHRVVSEGTTWVLSFRGPWKRTWREFDPRSMRYSTLTHGRKPAVDLRYDPLAVDEDWCPSRPRGEG